MTSQSCCGVRIAQFLNLISALACQIWSVRRGVLAVSYIPHGRMANGHDFARPHRLVPSTIAYIIRGKTFALGEKDFSLSAVDEAVRGQFASARHARSQTRPSRYLNCSECNPCMGSSSRRQLCCHASSCHGNAVTASRRSCTCMSLCKTPARSGAEQMTASRSATSQ